jgi:N-acyl-L-homoserine lactone synthetase
MPTSLESKAAGSPEQANYCTPQWSDSSRMEHSDDQARGVDSTMAVKLISQIVKLPATVGYQRIVTCSWCIQSKIWLIFRSMVKVHTTVHLPKAESKHTVAFWLRTDRLIIGTPAAARNSNSCRFDCLTTGPVQSRHLPTPASSIPSQFCIPDPTH